MKKPVASKRFQLNESDVKRWAKNTALFLAPAVVLVLVALQNNTPVEEILWIVRLWLLNTLLDLTRKFIEGNK